MLVRQITEIIDGEGEPTKWSIDMGTIIKWLDVLARTDNDYTLPNMNDPLLIVGLVGDPKLANKGYYARASKAFEILNDYAPGEKIDSKTNTRLINMFSNIEGAIAYFVGDWGGTPETSESWKIAIQKNLKSLKDTLEVNADKMENANTLFHEAMHRGFEVWRTLHRNGLISPSKETKWCILQSENGKDIRGKKIRGVNGEHALIYNKLQKNFAGRQSGWIRPWIRANKYQLIRDFGVLTPSFNDRYMDLTNDRQIFDKEEQVALWLDITYDKASDEIASYLDRKMLASKRPKARPGSGGYQGPEEPEGPEKVAALKNKQRFQDTLVNALEQLQADKTLRTRNKKQQLKKLLVLISGAHLPKHIEIINNMLDKIWRNTDELTAKMIHVGVNILYDPTWLDAPSKS